MNRTSTWEIAIESSRRAELPVAGQHPGVRADAARNRVLLLSVARDMLTAGGVSDLSMDTLAAKAGVGVGTVYRHFGDRAGLAYALLDDTERRFQAAFMTGPPPLGPGASPAARIRAFMHAYLARLETVADLHAMAESPAPKARYSAPYMVHRIHLIALLERADARVNPAFLADTLLAVLGAGLFLHQRNDLGLDIDDIKSGIDELLACCLGS